MKKLIRMILRIAILPMRILIVPIISIGEWSASDESYLKVLKDNWEFSDIY